jgi:DNA polymerase V
MELALYRRKESGVLIPLFTERIHAGFESPATDYQEERIDLNNYVTKYPEATFYAKVFGDCMTGSGIYEGDLLVVDKSMSPKNGDVVVGILDGEFILRAYFRYKNEEYLMPDNPFYKAIKRTESTFFEIWGVVPFTIHNQQNYRNVRLDRLQQLLR